MAPGKRILITGSSGLIGTNLGLALHRRGCPTIGIDLRLNPWTDCIPTLLCDLAEPDALSRLEGSITEADRPEIVVHLAAHPKVHRSVVEPERSCQDIIAAHTILEFCRHHRLPLIFASSREVYGNAGANAQSEDRADHHQTASPYAAGKIAVESLIYSYTRCFGIPGIVMRLSNVYGRYDTDLTRVERVVPLFIETIARDEEVTIFGDEKVLDFTYIDDCIDGLLRVIELMSRGYLGGHAVNLGTGSGHSLAELACFVGATLGVTPRIILKPSRTGEVRHYIADIGRARSLLGFNPRTDLSDGVARAVEWSLCKRGAL